jgi:hypothetical protein
MNSIPGITAKDLGRWILALHLKLLVNNGRYTSSPLSFRYFADFNSRFGVVRRA